MTFTQELLRKHNVHLKENSGRSFTVHPEYPSKIQFVIYRDTEGETWTEVCEMDILAEKATLDIIREQLDYAISLGVAKHGGNNGPLD